MRGYSENRYGATEAHAAVERSRQRRRERRTPRPPPGGSASPRSRSLVDGAHARPRTPLAARRGSAAGARTQMAARTCARGRRRSRTRRGEGVVLGGDRTDLRPGARESSAEERGRPSLGLDRSGSMCGSPKTSWHRCAGSRATVVASTSNVFGRRSPSCAGDSRRIRASASSPPRPGLRASSGSSRSVDVCRISSGTTTTRRTRAGRCGSSLFSTRSRIANASTLRSSPRSAGVASQRSRRGVTAVRIAGSARR